MSALDVSLRETEFLDHSAPEIQEFILGAPDQGSADQGADQGASQRARAVWLYYAVRDRIRYEIYGADLSRAGLAASQVLRSGSGMCLHKSVLYAAALRAIGVPSRLVLADVRNHLASGRLTRLLGGDVFHQHCLTSVYLDGRWVRATPVFNRTLCRLYGIAELDFDGTGDSLHHPYDLEGRRYLEFLREHGEFDDLPYDFVLAALRRAHPALLRSPTTVGPGSLAAEA